MPFTPFRVVSRDDSISITMMPLATFQDIFREVKKVLQRIA
eukprot:Gb_05517 [translate_table: standard]